MLDSLDPSAPFFEQRKLIAVQSFLGDDYVRANVDGLKMPVHRETAADMAGMARESDRCFVDAHSGPIMSWEEFEQYPWPHPANARTKRLDWLTENLPDGMCMIGSGEFGHFAEYLTWLMGYQTLCIALFEQRDLVAAIAQRLIDLYKANIKIILQYDRVKADWSSDDMGFRTGTLISPDDLREFVLQGHKLMAEMAHAKGHPYILHSCGKLDDILDDLFDDVKIDAKHSFEDAIEPVADAKKRYGGRVALLAGMDVDFLCRSTEDEVRVRTRETLEACMPGGGYCLGTGNSVVNYTSPWPTT